MAAQDAPECRVGHADEPWRGTHQPAQTRVDPVSITAVRPHEVETLLNSESLVAASACCRNFATQTGVSATTTTRSLRPVDPRDGGRGFK